MKRATVLVAVLVALCGPATLRAQEASCLVRVTFESQTLPLEKAIAAAVQSAGVGGAAIAEAQELQALLQARGEATEGAVHAAFEPLGMASDGSTQVLLGRLVVEIAASEPVPDGQTQAAQIVNGIAKRLQAQLEVLGTQDRERLEKRAVDLQAQVDLAQDTVAKLQAQQLHLLTDTGEFDLRRDALLERLRNWQAQRRDAKLRIAELEARQRSLAEQIAKATQLTEARVKEDVVATELERVVELRAQVLERAQALVKAGGAAQEETRKAEEGVALARVDLARRREEVAGKTSGKSLDELNTSLIQASAQLAEVQATAEAIEQAMNDLQSRNVLAHSDSYETLSRRQEIADEQLDMALRELLRAEQQRRTYAAPVVTILGGGD